MGHLVIGEHMITTAQTPLTMAMTLLAIIETTAAIVSVDWQTRIECIAGETGVITVGAPMVLQG